MSCLKNIIDLIQEVKEDQPFDRQQIVDIILPKKPDSSKYTLHDIDDQIYLIRNQVELLQKEKNDQFDSVLDQEALNKLENLDKALGNVQLDVMKLQCDIAYTKEQYGTMNNACDNQFIDEHRNLINEELALKKSLQEQIYKPASDYFEKLLVYLGYSICNCQRACTFQATNFSQSFDWSQYYQIIALIKASGKAIVDVDRFERLYQSEKIQIVHMNFKQPLEQLELNDFVEFPSAYSLETQLELTLIGCRENSSLNELLTKNRIVSDVVNSNEPIPYLIFEFTYQKLRLVAMDCCKLLVDLNMNYIESNLTEGIQVDKLNGVENPSALSSGEQQTLPDYAFSPQEYITQIGQHLLTLRKQTQQFDQVENRYLKFGLEFLQEAQDIPIDVKKYKTITEVIMRCITRHTIRSLLGRTGNSVVSKLTLNGRRQLATDALYLDNVLEDLGLLDSDEPNVDKFKNLLVQ